MAEMCKVTVIIPVYNTEKYLRQCLGYTIRRCLYHLGLWEDEENPGHKKRPLLRRFADCYAEHGLRYTVWRVLVYLHLSKDN